jgi:hypothetical protein
MSQQAAIFKHGVSGMKCSGFLETPGIYVSLRIKNSTEKEKLSCKINRSHLLRMVSQLEENGYITLTGSGSLRFSSSS